MKKLLALFVTFVIFVNCIHATNYTTVASGDWSNAATWDANGVPPATITATDQVFILAGHDVVLNLIITTNGGAIVNAGTINNTGTINNSGGTIVNNGTINNSGTIGNSATINTCTLIGGMIFNNPVNVGMIPLGTICDDGDPNTINDVITVDNVCTSCAGTAAAPIPTLSEWGLILLNVSLSILGIVGIRQRLSHAV